MKNLFTGFGWVKYWQMTFSLSNLKILCYKIIILATNDSEDHDTFNTLLLDDKTLTFFFSILSSILAIHTCGS